MTKKTCFSCELGLMEASTLVIGSMIGSGIFIAPSLMAGYLQSPLLLIALWVIGGIFTLCGALSYAELAAAMPKAGGQYVYLREAFGPLWGFLYGWTLILVIQTGFIAAVAVAFAKYLGVFFPLLSESTAAKDMNEKLFLYEKHGVKEYWIVNYWDKTITTRHLAKNGKYSKPTLLASDDLICSKVLKGLEISVNNIFKQI